MALTAGARLGPYEIKSPLGAGGMGEVYRAIDTRLDRVVAIKVLGAAVADDPGLKERFEREARTVSALNHPNICALYDLGRDRATDYLVLEYLEGDTLAARLEKGPLPVEQGVRVAMQIADALARAHGAGVVHRDLKPANIILTRSGAGSTGSLQAKLLDFGLAKIRPAATQAAGLTALATAPPELTGHGSILGTFQYMAPEQLEGQDADARTDIFAFGALLYEMLTGRKAFEGKTQASLIASILDRQPPSVSSLLPTTPIALDRVIRACLMKDPADRIQSAHDIALQLQWLADAPDTAVTAAAQRTRPLLLMATTAVLAATTLVFAVIALRGTRTAPPAEPIRFSVAAPPRMLTSQMELSPDGRQLAFVAFERGNRSSLWVRRLDSLALQQIRGSEGASLPFWSPDSRSVAFFADRKLKKVSIDGASDVQVIADSAGGGGGSWTAGDVILFASGIEGPLSRVLASGGGLAAVTTLDPAQRESGHFWPQLLPDGRHYLYEQLAAANSGLYVGALDSKDRTRLVGWTSMVDNTMPRYANGHLFYTQKQSLVAQRFDIRQLKTEGEPVRLADGIDVGGPGYAAFSVSDTTLAYRESTRVVSQLTWIDRRGQSVGTLGAPIVTEGLAISPDGRQIAVSRMDEKDRREPPSIWLIDAERGVSTRLTSGDESDNPVWSPDRKRIAFAAAIDSPPNLYVRNADGTGAAERLFVSPNQTYPSDWSPDGAFIVGWSVTPETGVDIWKLEVATRKLTPIFQSRFNENVPRISPDGRWMTYTSNETGRAEVYVTRFPESGGKWRVSSDGGQQPKWAKDSRELLYKDTGGAMWSARVTPDGSDLRIGAPERLFTLDALRLGIVNWVPAPDGRFLVNLPVGDTTTPPVTVIVNWLATLKR
jgi:eukaryotic-like serine/threonine-protein kinase